MLALIVMADYKAQDILSLIPISEFDELLLSLLNGSTVYSSLNCTSGYQYIAFSLRHRTNLLFQCWYV